MAESYDVAIIGGGIAGLSAALRLPAHLRVACFIKGRLGESNTRYAQGGLAAALGADDSPALHAWDTIAAGAGLCDEAAVHILCDEAPAAVRWLIALGAQFDRAQPGAGELHATADGLLLGREAAHSRWRILHAGGDASGAEIERALLQALRGRPELTVYEETFVSNLVVKEGVCCGVRAIDRDGRRLTTHARATILAAGGAGGLWLRTSNPAGATADGLALAWRAGAALTDLEFMQFHPTVLAADGGSHLISEAVRGEGAYLRNHAGVRFMPRYHLQAELAPRDIVARSILSEMASEGTAHQYLDLRHLPAERMHARFPTISAVCRATGLDLAADLIPVAPAAHYCMGGVMTDTFGRTTLPGLYAVGEVACTGVHGANRLASNSLLEGLVFGLRVADGLAAIGAPDAQIESCADPRAVHDDPSSTAVLELATLDREDMAQLRHQARAVMWQFVSLLRDQQGLCEASRRIRHLRHMMLARRTPAHAKAHVTVYEQETVNMLEVAELVIVAAEARRESRGSHWRGDFAAPDETLSGCHFVFHRRPTDLTQDGAGLMRHAGRWCLVHPWWSTQEVFAHA